MSGRAMVPMTDAEREQLTAAFRAAMGRAVDGMAALFEGWQQAAITVPPGLRRIVRESLVAAEQHRMPRHRAAPDPADVRGWLDLNAGGIVTMTARQVYGDSDNTAVPEVCMRRTRDNGVLRGDVMVRRALPGIYQLRDSRVRRRPLTMPEVFALLGYVADRR